MISIGRELSNFIKRIKKNIEGFFVFLVRYDLNNYELLFFFLLKNK